MSYPVALYLQDAHDIRQGIELVRYAETKGFDAVWQARLAGLLKALDGFVCHPCKDPRVAAGFLVAPLDDHFEVSILLRGSHHADRKTGAVEQSVCPTPGVLGAVDPGKIRFDQGAPTRLLVLDVGANIL